MSERSSHKTFILLLSLAFLPAFIFLGCPCAEASSSNIVSIERMPCHSCCPEMSISQAGCMGIRESEKIIGTAPVLSSSLERSSSLSRFFSTSSPHVFSARGGSAFGGDSRLTACGNDVGYSPPLYLALNVLRV